MIGCAKRIWREGQRWEWRCLMRDLKLGIFGKKLREKRHATRRVKVYEASLSP